MLNCSGPEDARHNPRDAPEASASKRELARSRMQSVGIGASGTVSSMLEVVIPSSLTVGALACWLVCAIAQRESPLQPQVRHRGTKCPSRSSERDTGLPDPPEGAFITGLALPSSVRVTHAGSSFPTHLPPCLIPACLRAVALPESSLFFPLSAPDPDAGVKECLIRESAAYPRENN